MRNLYIRIWMCCLGVVGGHFLAMGQQESTLFPMTSLSQSVLYNPAKALDYKLSISLPGLSGGYFSLANDGFALQDVMTVDNKVATISLTNLAESLKDRSTIRGGFEADWLGVYYRGKKFSVNFHAGDRVLAQFEYPKEMLELVVKGNGHPDFLGQNIVLDPKLSFVHYREYSLGGGYELMGGKLRLGANLKYLKGIAYIEDRDPSITLLTENEAGYPIRLTASGEIVTAGISEFIDSEDVSDYMNTPGNSGFAIDLGAVYQVNEQLSVEASILNIGSISWNTQVESYSFNTSDESYSFSGADALDIFRDDISDQVFNEELDSLEAIFDLENGGVGVATDGFSQAVPTQFMLGGKYSFGSGLSVNALMSTRVYRGNSFTQLSIVGMKEFGRWATAALSYTSTDKAPFNMGVGFSLNLPVQIHLVSDNLISGLIAPQSAKYISGRIGINLVFGHIKSKESKLIGEGTGEVGN